MIKVSLFVAESSSDYGECSDKSQRNGQFLLVIEQWDYEIITSKAS